jgi:hypothetical protein
VMVYCRRVKVGRKVGERLYSGDSALRHRFMLESGTNLHSDLGFRMLYLGRDVST